MQFKLFLYRRMICHLATRSQSNFNRSKKN